MEKLLNHIVSTLCSERGYASLFKAGVVLVGAALLAMSQAGTFLYEKDLAAHKAKFLLEVSIKQPLDKIDCKKAGAQQLDCLVAKHEMKILNSSLGFLDTIVQGCFLFGVLFAALSVLGFVCAPFVEDNNGKNGVKA